MAAEIHKDDIGTIFRVTLKDGTVLVDVSGATTQELIFKKPTGLKLTKTSAFTTDGTDGKIQYTTVSGDLDVLGVWSLQAHVILAAGEWRSDIETFEVFDNL